MEKENIFVLFAVVLRFVFTIKLNIDVNFAAHLNFVLMEEESQVIRTVVEEITANTTDRKSSASFAVDLKYVLTTSRNLNARSVLILSK